MTPQIRTNKAGTPIAYAAVAGLGLGLAFGVIKAFHLSLMANILSASAVLIICYLLFNRGKASAWSQAQAWAQNEVNVAVEVYNQAAAKAEALASAYSQAISNANASATNNITIQLPNGESKTLTQQEFEGIINASRNAQHTGVSMGDELTKESEALWSSTHS